MTTGFRLQLMSRTAFACLLCYLFCFISAPLQAQQPLQDDPLAPLYKSKKVKTVTATQISAQGGEQSKALYKEYNAAGNLIFEMVYDENGKLTKKYQGFFSTDNKLLKEVWTQEVTDSVIYKYKNGKLVEETWYWGSDKSKTRVVNFYDSLDRKVCTVSKNSWGVYVDSFFYESGRLGQTKNYNEHGLLTSISENIYDSKGRLTKTVLENEKGITIQTINKLYLETGPVKSSETVLYTAQSKTNVTSVAASMAENYKYDTQKQLKEINFNSYTNNELLVNNRITYVYNDKGLPLSQTAQNLVTNTKQVLRFTYTFF